MADVAHVMGQDLQLSAAGDLASVTGTAFGTQRVLHRLLTAPGAYLWHLEYGAGLPLFVGSPARAGALTALIRAQMVLERAVAQAPPPSVAVTVSVSGTVVATIGYADADTGQTATVAIPIEA